MQHKRNHISTYNFNMRIPFFFTIIFSILLSSCAATGSPSAEVRLPSTAGVSAAIPPGFTFADGSRPLIFPADFGAHPDFRTEWWYYTGNLQTPEGRPFGFELTIFRVGLLSPLTEMPDDSQWYSHDLYFAHFAVSDIDAGRFYAFERYSRPGPGLSGAQADPYRVWLEDWSIRESATGIYHLQAAQDNISLNLTLTDKTGVIRHGDNGYSRKGQNENNASYYYSQPRLQTEGTLKIDEISYPVSGLTWKDHEFSTGVLDENQIGWDWFSLQFDDGSALMLFQLRERDGGASAFSSGTFIAADGKPQSLQDANFDITVLDEWSSPHTGGVYPAKWQIQLDDPACLLEIHPWMADQEINFAAVTYWEGAVRFEGTCNGAPVRGNGYIELTGYAGNLPLP